METTTRSTDASPDELARFLLGIIQLPFRAGHILMSPFRGRLFSTVLWVVLFFAVMIGSALGARLAPHAPYLIHQGLPTLWHNVTAFISFWSKVVISFAVLLFVFFLLPVGLLVAPKRYWHTRRPPRQSQDAKKDDPETDAYSPAK